MGEQAGGLLQGGRQPPPAEVVPPPLDQHGGELQRDDALEKRDVLGDQLLLEADRVRGDDRPERLGLLLGRISLSFPGLCTFRGVPKMAGTR